MSRKNKATKQAEHEAAEKRAKQKHDEFCEDKLKEYLRLSELSDAIVTFLQTNDVAALQAWWMANENNADNLFFMYFETGFDVYKCLADAIKYPFLLHLYNRAAGHMNAGSGLRDIRREPLPTLEVLCEKAKR